MSTDEITDTLTRTDAVFNAPRGKASPSLENELRAVYAVLRAVAVAVRELEQREKQKP